MSQALQQNKLYFDNKTHHKDIIILSQRSAKTPVGPNGYRFAVMKPPIENGRQPRAFSFTITENVLWTAFGVCHAKLVESKQYQFVHSNIGHGAYMVSSNGGSWSHINALANNFVKVNKIIFADF
jgi:hypothetical protein